MGIFAHGIKEVSGVSSIVEDASLESILQDSDVDTSMLTEDPEYDGNEIIGTIYENYNTIMTNVALTEATYFERTGEDYVWTEGVLSNFVGMIKKFLKKIWEKIKGLFKRFTMMIDKYNMQDRAFVKKYRKELFSGKDLTDFTFKGYKYTIDDRKINAALAACTASNGIGSAYFRKRAGEGLEEFDKDEDQSKVNDKYNDEMEKGRGNILALLGAKGSGSYTQEEFQKELKEVWRNGESEKEELDDININAVADELMTSKDTRKTLNTMFKETKKTIETDEKDIERRQKELWNELPHDAATGAKKERDDKEAYGRARDKYYQRATANNGEVSVSAPKWYTDGGGTRTISGKDAYDIFHNASAGDVENVLKPKRQNKDFGDNQWGWDKSKGHWSNLSGEEKERFFAYAFYSTKQNYANGPRPDQSNFKQTNKQYANRASKEFNLFLKLVRDTKAVMMSIQTSCMAALKERSRQNKAICVKVINYNPKSESFTESYEEDYTPTSGVNFLSSIELK